MSPASPRLCPVRCAARGHADPLPAPHFRSEDLKLSSELETCLPCCSGLDGHSCDHCPLWFQSAEVHLAGPVELCGCAPRCECHPKHSPRTLRSLFSWVSSQMPQGSRPRVAVRAEHRKAERSQPGGGGPCWRSVLHFSALVPQASLQPPTGRRAGWLPCGFIGTEGGACVCPSSWTRSGHRSKDLSGGSLCQAGTSKALAGPRRAGTGRATWRCQPCPRASNPEGHSEGCCPPSLGTVGVLPAPWLPLGWTAC